MIRTALFALALCPVMLSGQIETSHASGRAILGGIKFKFWSSSSDSSVSHHQERPDRRTASAQNCWYVNEWQESRHGRTVKNRIRKCK